MRTNLVEEDPAELWSHYLLLVAVEEAFKNLKGDLAIRPIFHQIDDDPSRENIAHYLRVHIDDESVVTGELVDYIHRAHT